MYRRESESTYIEKEVAKQFDKVMLFLIYSMSSPSKEVIENANNILVKGQTVQPVQDPLSEFAQLLQQDVPTLIIRTFAWDEQTMLN